MISVSQSIKLSSVDCRVVDDGIKSDHFALRVLGENQSFKFMDKSIAREDPNLQQLQNDPIVNSKFNDVFMSKMNHATTYEDTCDFIQ